MLLTYFETVQNIMKCVLNSIEDHSVLVGVITSVVVSTFWFRKFIRQKRAEAFFDFYAKLYLYLKSLKQMLEDAGQLNVSDAEAGNIYSLIYHDTYIETACPSYKKLTDEDLKPYADAASELKNLLLKTGNNVYPMRADREKWYESQFIMIGFSDFLGNKKYRGKTNQKSGEGEPKHITKCKALIGAIDYILESILQEKY